MPRTKHTGRMMFIGIDNGVSGSIGIIHKTAHSEQSYFYHTPTIKEQDYTKKKSNITRVQVKELKTIFDGIDLLEYNKVHVIIERPMVNPRMFKATISAVRCLEATLGVIEMLGLSYEFIDSKEWQGELLPRGIKGKELKTKSLQIGKRLFPEHKDKYKKDADGMLIAEYCRRKYR